MSELPLASLLLPALALGSCMRQEAAWSKAACAAMAFPPPSTPLAFLARGAQLAELTPPRPLAHLLPACRLVDEVVWVKMTVNRRLAKSHGFYLQHAQEVRGSWGGGAGGG